MSRTLATAHMCLRVHLRNASPSLLTSRPVAAVQPGRHTSPLQLHIRLFQSTNHKTPARPLVAAVFLDVRIGQLRCQSTSPGSSGSPSSRPGPRPPSREKPPFFPFLLRVLSGSVRGVFSLFRGHNLKKLYRQNPEELILALAVLVACTLVLAYVVRIYFTYFYSRQFTRYPKPVAKYLRRALYFSNYAPDPKRALKNYKLALEQCDALSLDPFSDDVLGIRIQLAAWLEKTQNFEGATKILELVLADCKKWVDLMDKAAADGTAKDDGTLSARLPAPLLRNTPAALATQDGARADAAPSPDAETIWGRRARILRKAIGISVKLGELYADEHVLNAEQSRERLAWSVDTALREFKRRAVDGVKAGEGAWMSPQEMGAALESLGHSYEAQSQFQLALPLFFQALRMCDDPCHIAVIMNNLATSFAQYPLQPPYETAVGSLIDGSDSPGEGVAPITQAEARATFLQAAQRWATNAHHHATDTVGEARTLECDQACAVALCNLGDIAAMLGDTAAARKRFERGRAMSEKFDFPAGVQQADAGLRRLPPP